MKCIICGKELPETARFCTNCGMEVVDEEVTQNDEPIEIPKTEDNTVSTNNLKSNWKDKYTVIVIVAVMVLAAIGGVVVKKLNSETVDEEYYAYEDNYETDFNVSEEDEFDSEEYVQDENEYMDETEWEDQTSYEYILPESDTRFLTKADLSGLTAEECRLARNEIYARHGRIFKDEALQEYFESFSWYYPEIQPDDFEESMLNRYEIYNRDLIVEYETEMGYR